MAERTVATRAQEKASSSREETRSQERYITPPVDIYETDQRAGGDRRFTGRR